MHTTAPLSQQCTFPRKYKARAASLSQQSTCEKSSCTSPRSDSGQHTASSGASTPIKEKLARGPGHKSTSKLEPRPLTTEGGRHNNGCCFPVAADCPSATVPSEYTSPLSSHANATRGLKRAHVPPLTCTKPHTESCLEVCVQAETVRVLAAGCGHNSRLLILTNTLLKEVGLALEGDQLHPIEGI